MSTRQDGPRQRLSGGLRLGPPVDGHGGWLHPTRGTEPVPRGACLQADAWTGQRRGVGRKPLALLWMMMVVYLIGWLLLHVNITNTDYY